MVRKAQNSGVTVVEGGLELLDGFYQMLGDTFNRVGIKAIHCDFYRSILDSYRAAGKACVLVARREECNLAAVFLLSNHLFCHYWHGVKAKEAPSLGQGELLQWESIRWAKARGCLYYDLGGIEESRLPAVAAFKRDFAERLVPFYLRVCRTTPVRILSRLGLTS